MREIKFRAWDKKNKQMLNPASDIGNLMFAYGENYDHITKYDAEIMQYTGLKDKNGKEIYEGDVVFTKWSKPFVGRDDGTNREVFWADDKGAWALTNYNGKRNDLCSYLKTHAHPDSVEIIGNIYENPELLENK